MDDLIDMEGINGKVGAAVMDFDPLDFMEKRLIRRIGRAAQFALGAWHQALEDSKLDLDAIDKTRMGVVMGTGIGAVEAILENHLSLLERGPRRVSPFFIPKFMPNDVAAEISMAAGAKGPNVGMVSACASSGHAIGGAADYIKLGYADIMIAGGAEATLVPLTFAGFDQIKAMSRRNDEPEKASRPFDANRDGFVMGEGAGLLILESEEHAKARGAHIYAELTGYGQTGDAHHITEPAPGGEGAKRAMRLAMDHSGISPEEVDYINAHGTATPLNDKNETAAIKTVFENPPPVSSTKSQVGHLLGAAGAVEAVATIMAFEEGLLPPTINYETPDPECDLDVIPNKAREADINVALSNAFGFGGHNVCLAFRRA
jgi:3-oxoacyl-[acyl-carrier-protein] synthase II